MTQPFEFSQEAPIIARYEPPTHLSPGEVGMLHDGVFGQREVTATLIDMAVRGYITLHESSSGYEVELLRQDASMFELKTHEKLLLNGLFGVMSALEVQRMQASVINEQARANIQRYYADRGERPSMVGMVVSGDRLREKVITIAVQAEEQLKGELRAAGYYATPIALPSALVASGCFIALGVMPFVKDMPSGKVVLLLIMAAPVILAPFLYRISKTRVTRLGYRAKQYIKGFQLYLDVAERERYAGTQVPAAVEKDETRVVLYEKYLAYAIALGLERQWAGQFSSLERKTSFPIEIIGGIIAGLGALLVALPSRR